MQRKFRTAANVNLAQAIALLIHNQAAFLASQATFLAEQDETNKRLAQTKEESDKRFARIEADLEEIKTVLRRHEQILSGLTDAIRQKIGF